MQNYFLAELGNASTINVRRNGSRSPLRGRRAYRSDANESNGFLGRTWYETGKPATMSRRFTMLDWDHSQLESGNVGLSLLKSGPNLEQTMKRAWTIPQIAAL